MWLSKNEGFFTPEQFFTYLVLYCTYLLKTKPVKTNSCYRKLQVMANHVKFKEYFPWRDKGFIIISWIDLQ